MISCFMDGASPRGRSLCFAHERLQGTAPQLAAATIQVVGNQWLIGAEMSRVVKSDLSLLMVVDRG